MRQRGRERVRVKKREIYSLDRNMMKVRKRMRERDRDCWMSLIEEIPLIEMSLFAAIDAVILRYKLILF